MNLWNLQLTIYFQAERDGIVEERVELDEQVKGLEGKREELLADNRRMAEMLVTSEGDTREVADMMERLADERKQLQRQCHQFRENGTCVGSYQLPFLSLLPSTHVPHPHTHTLPSHTHPPLTHAHTPLIHTERALQQRVRELESEKVIVSPSSSVELRKLGKEREELRRAVTNFETELMQVQHVYSTIYNLHVLLCLSVCLFVCLCGLGLYTMIW